MLRRRRLLWSPVSSVHIRSSPAPGLYLYTYQNNLIFLSDPIGILPDISQDALSKVLLCAVRMSMYDYTCIHIRGVYNIWADLLTRWTIPVSIHRLVSIPPLPNSFAADLAWTSATALRESQSDHAATRPPTAVVVGDLRRTSPSGPFWVPDEDDGIRIRLIIVVHCGFADHRGSAATEKSLAKSSSWNTSPRMLRYSFLLAYTVSQQRGASVPLLFGPSLHGTKPKDLVQFEYI